MADNKKPPVVKKDEPAYVPLHKRSCAEQRAFALTELGLLSDHKLNEVRFKLAEGDLPGFIAKNASKTDKTGSCAPDPWQYGDRATEVILERYVQGANSTSLMLQQGLSPEDIANHAGKTSEQRKALLDQPANDFFLRQKINPFELTKTWDALDADGQKIFLQRGEALRSRTKRASEAGETGIALKFLDTAVPNTCARAYHEAMTRSGEGKPNIPADANRAAAVNALSQEAFEQQAKSCIVNPKTSADTSLGWLLGTRRGTEVYEEIQRKPDSSGLTGDALPSPVTPAPEKGAANPADPAVKTAGKRAEAAPRR